MKHQGYTHAIIMPLYYLNIYLLLPKSTLSQVVTESQNLTSLNQFHAVTGLYRWHLQQCLAQKEERRALDGYSVALLNGRCNSSSNTIDDTDTKCRHALEEDNQKH